MQGSKKMQKTEKRKTVHTHTHTHRQKSKIKSQIITLVVYFLFPKCPTNPSSFLARNQVPFKYFLKTFHTKPNEIGQFKLRI